MSEQETHMPAEQQNQKNPVQKQPDTYGEAATRVLTITTPMALVFLGLVASLAVLGIGLMLGGAKQPARAAAPQYIQQGQVAQQGQQGPAFILPPNVANLDPKDAIKQLPLQTQRNSVSPGTDPFANSGSHGTVQGAAPGQSAAPATGGVSVGVEQAGVARKGAAPPTFSLPGVDGKNISLDQFKGHPLVINFWATWCSPCRYEMPFLQQAQDKYRDQGLVVLGVDVAEDPSLVGAFAKQFNLSFPIVVDGTGAVSNIYQAHAIPITYFVDKNGVVTDVHPGAMNESILKGFLSKILTTSN
ncbi:MAG: TlpA family protein disulfide reductase [Chloroflexi bacterium]|nr:TlpA family protein disulfide reductase [Chloroflexota bacterium]